jgi:hypothetical protein
VLDGLRLGYAVRVPREAVAAVDLLPGEGDRALGEMGLAGASLA